MDKIEELLSKGFDLGIQLIIALIILIIGFNLVKKYERHLRKKSFRGIESSAKGFIISLITLGLKAVLIIIAASIIGIPTTTFITILGSCGLALGLALQGGLSNLAGGVMILAFKPFKVGDVIEVNGNTGTVKSITMFYTVITTFNGEDINLPNGNLSNDTIKNYTVNPYVRLALEFNVSYDTKIDKVKKIIKTIVDKEELINHEIEPVIRLSKHADSSLTYDVKVWTTFDKKYEVMYNLEENIKEAFDKNKIEIPYPQLDVHQK